MASNSVTTSGNLGSNFLAMIGDIKGAAKEAKSELRDASAYTKTLERDAKQLERMLAKDERQLERLRSQQGKAKSPERQQEIQAQIEDIMKRRNTLTRDLDKRTEDISAAQAKEIAAAERKITLTQQQRDMRDSQRRERGFIANRFSRFENMVQGQLGNVQSNLMHASKVLASVRGGAIASRAVGRAAAGVGQIATFAGPIGIGVGLGVGAAALAGRVIQSQRESAEIDIAMSEVRRDFISGVTDASGGAALINKLNAQLRASEMETRRRFGGDTIGSRIDEYLRTDLTGQKKAAFTRSLFERQSLSARAQFGGIVSSIMRGDNKEFQSQVQSAFVRNLEERNIINASWVGLNTLMRDTIGFSAGETLDDIRDQIDMKKRSAFAQTITDRIDSNRQQFNRNPERVSERHQQLSYFQALYNDRLTRSMQWSAF